MRYLMRQKIFAFGDDFVIRDEEGRDRFIVDGKMFSIGKQLSFRDMEGNELAFIRQKLLVLAPTYEIARGDRVIAMVKKELFTLFHARFSIDLPGADDLEAQGDLLDHEYVFTRQGQTVAQVSKRWFALSDTYGVDVTPGEDDVLILASTVVIDMVLHDESRRREHHE
jgi:uncharacterized protein YxjI